VVDDDVDIRDFSAWVLTAYGYQTDTAADSADAWKALRTRSYDLLITDHNMPKVTGIELVRALRSERMALPVVLMSGTLPEEALVQNSSLQLAGTLLKPFTMEQLVGTVTKVLSAAQVGASTAASSTNADAATSVPRVQI
jgi:Response regulator containing CheY-like receiver, AAA-type ATPase, and DNA-binding domains